MDVSIIIVNYNTSNLINNCIRSILETVKDIEYEIIIVDNATELLRDVIESSNDPKIKLIQLPKNLGFGQANNAGADTATGRNLFFLNPDTILINNAIKILSDYLDHNSCCGICGGNLYDGNSNPTLSYRRILPSIKWEINEFLHLLPEKIIFGKNRIFNYSSCTINVAYITGADLMIRKDIYEKISGFSSDFFMYYEETDLCRRISNLNLLITSVPHAKIKHLEGQSFVGDINTTKIKYLEKGRLKYYHRNHNKIYTYISNQIYRLFLITRIIVARNNNIYKYYKSRYDIFNILIKHRY